MVVVEKVKLVVVVVVVEVVFKTCRYWPGPGGSTILDWTILYHIMSCYAIIYANIVYYVMR